MRKEPANLNPTFVYAIDYDGCMHHANYERYLEYIHELKNSFVKGDPVKNLIVYPLLHMTHSRTLNGKGISDFENGIVMASQVVEDIFNLRFAQSMKTYFKNLVNEWQKLLSQFESAPEAIQLFSFLSRNHNKDVGPSITSGHSYLFNAKAWDDLINLTQQFLEIQKKLTLGVLVSHLLSQGYNPEQHTLRFISASARINKAADTYASSLNHNGTVLELMEKLPGLVKDFFKDNLSIDKNALKVEFLKNLPLDVNDKACDQIHTGDEYLYDESKTGILLWLAWLLKRKYPNDSFKVFFLDDLIIRPSRNTVKWAIAYLAENQSLLPQYVELYPIGFMPAQACWGDSIFHQYDTVTGTGNMINRQRIQDIIHIQDKANPSCFSRCLSFFCCSPTPINPKLLQALGGLLTPSPNDRTPLLTRNQ